MTRYHYNPETGKVGACRADPSKPNSRGCKFQLAEDDHFSTALEASRAYETTQEIFPPSSRSAGARELSPEQQTYFGKSAVRDDQGNLLEVHHGSPDDFHSFDPALIGNGADAWGSGFYFATNKNQADGYSAGKGAREFYLAVSNPLKVDGRAAMSLIDVQLTPEQNRSIIASHPDLQLQPGESEDLSNPLEDYSESYWSREHHSPSQLRAMADEVAKKYFSEAGLVELRSFFGRDRGQEFLKAVNSVTGYDGVEVDFGPQDGKFFVAWFPEQIKLSSNGTPTDSARVDS